MLAHGTVSLALKAFLPVMWPWFVFATSQAADSSGTGGVEPDTTPLLIRDSAVRSELKLSAEQTQTIDLALRDANRAILALRDADRRTADEGIRTAMQRLDNKLLQTLAPIQRNRFREIALQVLGAMAVLRPDVAQALNLSEPQRQRLLALARTTAAPTKNAVADAETQPSNVPASPRQRERDRRIYAVLTAEQKAAFGKLLGKSFDLSRVEPIGVDAPEFENPSAWINSDPLTMAGLRGQVVVVHFYTFGCGNCINNYRWYKGWQEAFGGKGVTIIGIHTPESDGERDVEAVRRKAAKAGLIFPILVDNDKSNWLAWSNQVWPSVYLVDKLGHVRYWWYGELNWKGAPGEQRMRHMIQKLLAEQPTTQPVSKR